MRLSKKILLIVLTVSIVVVMLSVFLSGYLLKSHLQAQQSKWLEVVSHGINESVSLDLKKGDRNHLKTSLVNMVRKTGVVEYVVVFDKHNNIYEHSFQGNLPAYFEHGVASNKDVEQKSSVVLYNANNEIIREYDVTKQGEKEYKLHVGVNSQALKENVDYIVWELLLLISVLGLAGILVVLFMIYRVNKPMSIFLDRLHSYTKSGKVEIPSSEGLSNDVASLVETFRSIVVKLEDAKYELSVKENNLSITFDSIGEAVIVTDSHGYITRMNSVAEKLTAWNEDEAIGELLGKVLFVVDENTRKMIPGLLKNVLVNGDSTFLKKQITLLAKNNDEYQVSVSLSPVRDKNKNIKGSITVLKNMTEQYQMRDELRSHSSKLQLHREQTPLGVIEWDSGFKVTDWNPAAEKIFGYSKEEAIGKYAADLIIPEEVRGHVDEVWESLIKERGGRRSSNENITREGKKIYCEWYNTPLVNENGDVVGVASLVEDVTERRQNELALRRSQRMDAIGHLSGGIAHDFNNQLSIVIGYLDALKEDYQLGEDELQCVDIAVKATKRSMDLSRQLLNFSRQQPNIKIVVDVNQSISGLKNMIERSVTPQVEVEYELSPNLWLTELDTGEFNDAIINMVINSRDAMEGKGKLFIETKNTTINEEGCAFSPEATPGDYVLLSISDNGCGMSDKVLEHIFEPFYTTKEVGKGTGLGMAMVYAFVKRYSGFIRIYSEEGMGTTLRIYLPRYTGVELANNDGEVKSKLPRGTESILIVDDEKELAALANRYLSSLGYKTTLAENSQQALEIIHNGQKVDLLFSDVVMPGGIDGYELAQESTTLQPSLKVLLTSGFTGKLVDDGKKVKSVNMLNKPCRKEELAIKIRTVLDGLQ